MAGSSLAGYVKVDGVDGNSTDKGHKGWIEFLKFNHSISQATSARSVSGHGATERANVDDFTITKALDKTSPKLYLMCCKGQRIPSVTVEIARASGDSATYMKWVFKDVIISGVHPEGGSSEM
jgi:type VI secretion system secreted protein Hcp